MSNYNFCHLAYYFQHIPNNLPTYLSKFNHMIKKL